MEETAESCSRDGLSLCRSRVYLLVELPHARLNLLSRCFGRHLVRDLGSLGEVVQGGGLSAFLALAGLVLLRRATVVVVLRRKGAVSVLDLLLVSLLGGGGGEVAGVRGDNRHGGADI